MEALHRCVFPWITRLVWKHYHPPLDFQDAEDVASEVVTQVWRYAGLTLAEIGQRLGISGPRVHQVLRRLAQRFRQEQEQTSSDPGA